jgi:uncharacterized membrane protein
MENMFASFFRSIIKLVLAAFALVFVVCLLLLALIVVLLSVLKAAITGKKPAPSVVFGNFQKFAPGGMWPGYTRTETKADVVDVEVREIKDPGSDQPPQ